MVPETLRFNLTGKLADRVTARDLILTIIGMIGANGANYHAMEFVGDGMKDLTMSDRISICNLCVEACNMHALSWDKNYAISSWHKEEMEDELVTAEGLAYFHEVMEKAKAEAEAEAKAAAEKAEAEKTGGDA